MGEEVTFSPGPIQVLNSLRQSLTQLPQCAQELAEQRSLGRFISEVAERHTHFQKSVLGVWVGGYAFVNPEDGDVLRLFLEEEHPLRGSSPSFPLPYVWDKGDASKYAVLMNSMFEAWRSVESLSPTRGPDAYPPEYFSQLPFESSDASRYDTPEEAARAEFGCHYVTIGELSFFLYAWRLLLRLAQKVGWHAMYRPGVLSLADRTQAGSTDSLWDPGFWIGLDTRERVWLRFISNEPPAEVLDAWQETTRAADGPAEGGRPWLEEWKTLQLIMPQNGPGMVRPMPALTATLRYAIRRCSSRNHVLESVLRDHLRSIATRGASITLEEAEAIDLALQRAVGLVTLEAPASPNSLCDALRILHCLVRFPLLPYYYWLVIDPSPRTHLVFPVWYSFHEVVQVWHPQREPLTAQECLRRTYGEVVGTNVVGVALLAVRPVATFDWTLEPLSEEATADERNRVVLIRDYYELLARPVADQVYYRKLSSKLARAEGDAERALVGDVNHRLGNIRFQLDYFVRGVKREGRTPKELVDFVASDIGRAESSLRDLKHYCERLKKLAYADEARPFDLDTLIEEVTSEFRTAYAVAVTYRRPAAGTVAVFGRRTVLWFVLDELLYNAMKQIRALANGEIRIHVWTGEDSRLAELAGRLRPPAQDEVLVEVRDNGAGVSPKAAGRLFERGFSSTESTGYGLWRVRTAIEEEFRGRVAAAINQGGGAAFGIYLKNLERRAREAT